MSKGPSQTGTQTTTSVDPRAQYQAPYLQTGWDASKSVFQNTQLNPQGYNTLWQAGAGPGVSGVRRSAHQPFPHATRRQ